MSSSYRTWVRTVARLGAVLLVIAVSVCASLIAHGYYQRRKAEQLLHELSQLKTRETSEAEVRSLVGRFGGHQAEQGSGADVLPEFEIEVNHTEVLGIGLGGPFLRAFGLRPWWLRVRLQVHAGRLEEYDLALHANSDSDLWNSVGVSCTDEMPFGYVPEPYQVVVPHRTGAPGESILVVMSSQASPVERAHAFDIQITCLTRTGGCERACQMMPAAWKDWIARREKQGAKPPDADDPRCK